MHHSLETSSEYIPKFIPLELHFLTSVSVCAHTPRVLWKMCFSASLIQHYQYENIAFGPECVVMLLSSLEFKWTVTQKMRANLEAWEQQVVLCKIN